jgi:HSP20 family protein
MNLVKFHRNPFFSGILNEFDKDFSRNENCNVYNPAVNIIEDEKQFTLELAAPGLIKDDFNINLDNQVLTISKEAKEEKKEVKDNYTRREFVYNSFSRSFRLPKFIVAEKIKADYKDGILRISLPKDEKATLTRQISVN